MTYLCIILLRLKFIDFPRTQRKSRAESVRSATIGTRYFSVSPKLWSSAAIWMLFPVRSTSFSHCHRSIYISKITPDIGVPLTNRHICTAMMSRGLSTRSHICTALTQANTGIQPPIKAPWGLFGYNDSVNTPTFEHYYGNERTWSFVKAVRAGSSLALLAW